MYSDLNSTVFKASHWAHVQHNVCSCKIALLVFNCEAKMTTWFHCLTPNLSMVTIPTLLLQVCWFAWCNISSSNRHWVSYIFCREGGLVYGHWSCNEVLKLLNLLSHHSLSWIRHRSIKEWISHSKISVWTRLWEYVKFWSDADEWMLVTGQAVYCSWLNENFKASRCTIHLQLLWAHVLGLWLDAAKSCGLSVVTVFCSWNSCKFVLWVPTHTYMTLAWRQHSIRFMWYHARQMIMFIWECSPASPVLASLLYIPGFWGL